MLVKNSPIRIRVVSMVFVVFSVGVFMGSLVGMGTDVVARETIIEPQQGLGLKRGDDSGELPFEIGEKLTYSVRWGFIPVGKAVLWVRGKVQRGDSDALYITAQTRSNAVISVLYPVRDTVESYFDYKNESSLWFRKALNECRYHCDKNVYFDYEKGVAKWVTTKGKVKLFDLRHKVLDSLSVLYYYRMFADKENKPFKTSVFADEKHYDLEVKVVKKKKKKIGAKLGRREILVVEPLAKTEGMFVSKGKMYVWVTNDEECIPVRLIAKAPILGRLTARLVKREVVKGV